MQFETSRGIVRAVDGISYTVNRGEMVAIVGESGCGKSVSSLAIMRLLAKPAGRVTAGRVLFEGRDLLELSDEEMREIRGRDIAMIFQEPMTSLNPVLTIGAADHGAAVHPPEDERGAGARARARAAAAGRHHRRRAPARAVSASALRRHAPARDDRDRARLQSQAPHRRRADHRARRHHPGADPGADEGPVAPARHRADHHHAQSRRGRPLRRPRQRDVRGAHRRAGHAPTTSSCGRCIPTRSA